MPELLFRHPAASARASELGFRGMSPKNNTQDHMGVLLLGNFHIPEEGNYFILNYVKATAGRATLSLSLSLSLAAGAGKHFHRATVEHASKS